MNNKKMPAIIVILKNKKICLHIFHFYLPPLRITVNKTGVSLSLEI